MFYKTKFIGGGEDVAKGNLKYTYVHSLPGGFFSVSIKISGHQAGWQKPVGASRLWFRDLWFCDLDMSRGRRGRGGEGPGESGCISLQFHIPAAAARRPSHTAGLHGRWQGSCVFFSSHHPLCSHSPPTNLVPDTYYYFAPRNLPLGGEDISGSAFSVLELRRASAVRKCHGC